ncbi:hypothetical protein FMUBM48_51940 [Nocardia cyriacigeorgica]|nr:hypothetical protein FMUBM48_51940 [Nocardia cyriacigeorgica]
MAHGGSIRSSDNRDPGSAELSLSSGETDCATTRGGKAMAPTVASSGSPTATANPMVIQSSVIAGALCPQRIDPVESLTSACHRAR